MALAALAEGRAPLPAPGPAGGGRALRRPSCSGRCRAPTAGCGARTAPGAARCPASWTTTRRSRSGCTSSTWRRASTATWRESRRLALLACERFGAPGRRVLRHGARRRGARRAAARARRQPDAVRQLDAGRAARAAWRAPTASPSSSATPTPSSPRSGRCWRARRRASVICSASATRCSRRRARPPWSAPPTIPLTSRAGRGAARSLRARSRRRVRRRGATIWACRCSAGRGLVAGRPAVYVCSGFVCAAPATDPHMVRTALLNANPT